MPFGNLTSQFFANVYLNELDYFVKHELKVKYYIRYVDDFVVLHENQQNLEKYKDAINKFLIKNLKIKLHPEKSKIIRLDRGINLLGYRAFYYHKLLRKSNKRKFERNFSEKLKQFGQKEVNYEDFTQNLQGWLGYAMWANTYRLRKTILEQINDNFYNKIADN